MPERVECRIKGCKTVVGNPEMVFCLHHDLMWRESKERPRIRNSPARARTALADFVRRVSLEEERDAEAARRALASIAGSTH